MRVKVLFRVWRIGAYIYFGFCVGAMSQQATSPRARKRINEVVDSVVEPFDGRYRRTATGLLAAIILGLTAIVSPLWPVALPTGLVVRLRRKSVARAAAAASTRR